MSDIVVSKIIDFKARDNATGVITQIKQAQDTLKDKDIHLTAVGDETKITSFHQKLDGLPKDVQTKLNAMAERNGFDTFDSYMKSLPKEQYSKLKANVERNGFEAFKSDLKSLPKSQQTELKSKLDSTGFRTFKEWYDKVPKEARTQLNAIANKVPIEDFFRETEKIPKHLNTKVEADVNGGNSALVNFSNHIDKAKEKTSKFKSILAGSFVGSMMTTGLMSIVGGLKSATSAAMEYANAQQIMNATWKTLTGSAKDGKKMVDMTNKMAIAANNSTHMVDQLNQKFYSVNDSAQTTKKLTTSVLTLQDAFGKTDDEVENFGTQWGQMVSNGKVSAQDMMSFVNVFPKLRIELLKTEQKMTGNKNLTMKQLNDMISAGKVSSDTMDKVLEDTATKYGKATKNFGATIAGMKRTIQSQVPVLLSAFTEPFLNAQNPIYKAVSDWVEDKHTKDKFSDLGKTISTGMSNAMSALSGGTGGQKDFTANLNRGIDSVNKGFKVFFGYITAHAKDLKTIGGSLNEILKVFLNAIWKDVGSIITTIGSGLGLMKDSSKNASDPLHAVANALKGITKHKTAIKAIAGYLVAMKTFKMAKGAFDPLLKLAGMQSKGGGLLTKVIGKGDNQKKVFRFGVAGFKDAKLKIADFITGTKANFTALFNFISKGFQGGKFSKTSAGNMSMGSKIATAGATVGVAATAGLDIVGAIKAKNPEQKFEGFGKAAGGAIGGGIGFMLGGPAGEVIGAALGRTLGKWGGKAAKNFTDGWNKAGRGAKPPKGIIQKAGYYSRKAGDAVANWTKGITAWIGKHKKEILLTLANPFLGIGDFILKDTKTGKKVTKWMAGLEKSVKTSTKGKKGLGNNLTGIFKGVGDWLLKDKSTKKGFDKWMSGLESSVKKSTKGKKGLLANVTGTFEGVSKWFKKDKVTKKAAQKWSDELKNIFSGKNGFVKAFSNSLDSMEKSLKKSKFGKSWDSFWKDTQKTTTNWDKNISKWWSGFSKDFGKKWDRSWKDRKTDMHDDWKSMHSAYDDFTTGISKWWSNFSASFSKSWNQNWRDRKTDMHDDWKSMHSAYDDFTTGINAWWSGFKTSFQSGWSNFWKGVQNIFKDIFGTFKGLAHDAMKGVVGAINGGIGGINTVIKFFGGKAQSIAPIKYASGVGYHPGGPALINDQKGSVFEEAFKNPGEPWQVIPKMRNVMVDLKPGATVVPAAETARRFAPSSIPHYAGGVGGWVKGELSDMGKWVKDKLKGITSFLKDPLGNLISVWDKATSKITQPTKFGNVFAPPAGHYVVKQSINWFKDQMNKLKDKELEAQSFAGGARPASAYGPMIKAAAAYMHQSITDFNVDMIERIIGNESGGDPNVTNNWDSNAKAGHPSTGILQYILPTFLNYAMPGHTNIHNPLDQLIALFNDATWRSDMGMGYNGKYGEWRGSASGPSGPRLMANGGHMFSPTPSILAEDGDEFAINPSKPSAIPLAGDLMGRIADFHPEFRSSNLANNISADIGRKLEMVIDLLGSINSKDFSPEINIAKTSSNMNLQNQRETGIYSYQQGMRQ